jgi:phage-related protein
MCLFLFPRHDASSCCGWRRRPTGTDGGCGYIEQAVADSREGAYSSLGIRRCDKNPSQ